MKVLLDKLLTAETETEVLEFKIAEKQFDKNKLGKYFSALSNEANIKGQSSAWLVFGVNDNKEIVGTHINDKQLNEYKLEIFNHTSPKLSFMNIHRIKGKDGDVLLLEVPPAPKGNPVSWKGHWYGRNGESLGALNVNKLDSIRKQHRVADWSAQTIDKATLKDLDVEAIYKARRMFTTKNPKLKEEINSWDDITFLNKAKITIQGKITNTAILLLGKSESEHFLSPATSKISWILKDKDGIEKDYEHFTCPLLLAIDKVQAKIRYLKYRYIKDGTLFPDEVDQYDPYIVREALNNCIAHQDYSLGGKINLVEYEDAKLTFANAGSFIPGSVEKVIVADAPETNYRNPFLANAMVNLNMIDTIGSGIKKMFVIQKNKFFPLPDYDIQAHQVQVKVIGKILDLDYARKIAQMPDLSLNEIVLLDKVSKQKVLTDNEVALLKSKNLIEGRRPNYHISLEVAKVAGEEIDYIEKRGLDDQFYENLIIEYLKKFKTATSGDLKKLLNNKLPTILDDNQKQNKLRNMLQKLKRNKIIAVTTNRSWKLV